MDALREPRRDVQRHTVWPRLDYGKVASGAARAAGESEQRLSSFPAWHETPFFSERERTALAWAEAVTAVADSHVADDVYGQARRHFSEKELVDLTVAIVAINGWNRLATAFRSVPGTHEPKPTGLQRPKVSQRRTRAASRSICRP